MRVLDAGVDTLYWSAKAPVTGWYDDAMAARDAAKAAGEPLPWREVRGYALSALPHGRSRYPFAARAAEFELRLTDADRVPTAYVQLRSSFIRTEGVEKAAAESVGVVSDLVGSMTVPKTSRVDVFADFADFQLRGSDRLGIHTRSEIAAYFTGGEDDALPSVRVGNKPLKVRVYDKRRELRKRGESMPAAWGGFEGPVTRVEVEADAEALRRFGIDTIRDAVSSYGDIWRHGTTRVLVLRVPGDGPQRTWPVRDEWRVVQQAGERQFPSSGLVPFEQVKGDRLRVLRVLYGALVSLGAHLDVRDLEATLAALPSELQAVARGRDYAAQVERRWARLPRIVRERVRRPVDSSRVSAGAWKENPCDQSAHFQVNTRTNA